MSRVDEILVQLRKGFTLTAIYSNPKFNDAPQQLLRLQILEATKLYLSEVEEEVSRLQSLLSDENMRLMALQANVREANTRYARLTSMIKESQNELSVLRKNLSKYGEEKETKRNELDSINARSLKQNTDVKVHAPGVEAGEGLLEGIKMRALASV